VFWGLLSSVFERKEYIDLAVLEGLAVEMLKDPKVATEWQSALKDEAFAKVRKPATSGGTAGLPTGTRPLALSPCSGL
jgi:hypothetical protein